jgi:predicted SnoaL-like aldol condensation-catalyzing enzyme
LERIHKNRLNIQFFEDSYTQKNIGVSSRENGMVRYFAALAESF